MCGKSLLFESFGRFLHESLCILVSIYLRNFFRQQNDHITNYFGVLILKRDVVRNWFFIVQRLGLLSSPLPPLPPGGRSGQPGGSWVSYHNIIMPAYHIIIILSSYDHVFSFSFFLFFVCFFVDRAALQHSRLADHVSPKYASRKNVRRTFFRRIVSSAGIFRQNGSGKTVETENGKTENGNNGKWQNGQFWNGKQKRLKRQFWCH